MDNEQEIITTLQRVQAKHLRGLEQWAATQGKVTGVPVVQVLNYDLIQLTNQAYLRHLLKEQEGSDNGSAS